MSDWLPSLNALKAFDATARHLSYTGAAAELGVTPAAVKQMVGKLEQAIGASLVQRDGKGLKVTSLGQSAVGDLSDGMQSIAEAVRKMRDPHLRRRLVISCEASFASSWLVPNLAEFRRDFPQINVLVESSQRLARLHEGDADIAIRYCGDNSGLVAYRLFDDEIFPVCSPALVEGRALPASITELRHMPLIHSDMSRLGWITQARKYFDWRNWAALLGFDFDPMQNENAGFFDDYDQAMQVAVAGLGVVLASGPVVQGLLDRGLLIRPFAEKLLPDVGFDVVTTSAASERADVQSFVEWIRAMVSSAR